MDRVRGRMKEGIYKKEKKSKRQFRILWYTTKDGERRKCCTINNVRDRAIREKAREEIIERRSKAKMGKFD